MNSYLAAAFWRGFKEGFHEAATNPWLAIAGALLGMGIVEVFKF